MKKSLESPKFTISHLAILIGTSAAVLRAWERKGLIYSPRDQAGNRKYDVNDISGIATKLFQAKKISQHRYYLIHSWVDILQALNER